MKDRKYFCYEIYKNMAIWSYDGQVGYSPCSFYQSLAAKSNEFDLGDYWNSSEHKTIKIKVENDQPIQGCEPCYNLEQAGIKSRRQSCQELYENYHQDTDIDDDGPTGIDYSVGNLCNLKCVICNPQCSTSWIPDYQKLNPEKSIEIFQYKKHNQLEVSDPTLLKNLKSVHFHGGGEPLLSENHLNLLKNIKAVKGLSDVRVFYNTNGTVKPTQETLDLWAECKLIEIYFSIDDIGKRFEYQRTGSNWEQVVNIMSWYYENMPHNHMFNINCVWSYLNLYYLDELYDWQQTNFNTTRYGDPVQLIFQKAHGDCEINSTTTQAHDVLMKKFKNRPELTMLVQSLEIDNDATPEKFLNYIKKLDSIRGNDFHTICPEWSKLLV
jgi:hypothetical protein